MMNTKLLGLLVVLLASGCSHFRGEWVQDARIEPDGKVVELQGSRKALSFDGGATVMSGQLLSGSGVVAADSVRVTNYWTVQDDRVAQFGEMNARMEDGYLITDTGGDASYRFVRHRGPSVFPPRVKAPAF
jgi:hypothetical protein